METDRISISELRALQQQEKKRKRGPVTPDAALPVQCYITDFTLFLSLPIVTVSEANNREHWTAQNARKQQQQSEVRWEWKRLVKRWRPPLPCTIRFTRLGPNKLDSDNLQRAFKGIRDEVCSLIGEDDGSPLLDFEYHQAPFESGPRQYQVRIEIRPRES